MTCDHCKDDIVTLVANEGAGAINRHTIQLNFNQCNDAGRAVPTIFCTCECHGIRADRGAQ